MQGTRIVVTYRGDDGDSGGTVDFTDDRTIGGIVSFNGRQARETNGTTTSTVSNAGAANSTSTTDTSTYTIVTDSVPQVLAIGTESFSTSQAQGFTITTDVITDIDPGILSRFNLNAGESYNDSYTTTVTTTVNTGGFGSSTQTTETDTTRTVRYVGRQTVSVPAGTFETCRFDSTSTTTFNGESSTSSSTDYFGVGNGILIKNESGGDMTELQSATINGAAIR